MCTLLVSCISNQTPEDDLQSSQLLYNIDQFNCLLFSCKTRKVMTMDCFTQSRFEHNHNHATLLLIKSYFDINSKLIVTLKLCVLVLIIRLI